MTFQSTVNTLQGFGVIGEVFAESPIRSAPYILNTPDAANNVIGRAMTVVSEGVARVGGTGAFAGILVSPKEYASGGTSADGSLAPTLTLRNGEIGAGLTMGEVIIAAAAAGAIGDRIFYDNTTGVLGTTAEVAQFTASQTTTVLTVTAITAGNLGVGSVVNTGATAVTIVSLGTGTGGTGTYNVSESQSVASGAMTAISVAPSGKTFVPTGRLTRYTPTGAGLAVAKLTN